MNDHSNGQQWVDIRLYKPEERDAVPIVADAGMAATGVADGRFMPLVILDTTRRPDIEDAVKAHMRLGPGDVRSYWLRPSRWHQRTIGLLLDLERPSQCVISMEFDVARQGAFVDQIIRMQGLYVQPGRPGDRLSETMRAPRILVEVPSRQIRPVWDEIFERQLVRRLRKEGLSKREARRKAREMILRWRSATGQRMRSA